MESVFCRVSSWYLCVFWMVGVACVAAPTRLYADEVRSPDGKLVVSFEVVSVDQHDGCLVYRMAYDGKPVLADSRLGLVADGGAAWDRGWRVTGVTTASGDQTWTPVCGERSRIRDHYNEMTVSLQNDATPQGQLRLIFRAYDEGAAFCYELPKQEGPQPLKFAAERSEFSFTGNWMCWPVYSAQGVYTTVLLDQVKPNCERPLVVEIAGGPYVAVGEARLVDYARMRLEPAGKPHTIRSMLAGPVVLELPYRTPWRVVMVGQTPGELLEHNDLILNLNDPCALADTSWIRPGKVIREVTLTTAGGKACIDFAVKRGLQFVEYDAGWYGHEYDDASNATTVSPDRKKSNAAGGLDLQEVIRYGNERGIGIVLYVNRRELEHRLDEILPLYEQWGVKGVKYGFVNVGSQHWTTWLHEAVRKAARHRLMVDVHDEYRPTGYERTYPNLMTQEGIRGNECMPPAEHNLILPFTRMLCGPADYTVCWYASRIQTSHAHQLACPVVYYSPWQFLHWYDRPAQYRGEPELDFFKVVPAVWDDTRVIQGEIGQHITVARRSGEQWFVGTMNAQKRRQLQIPLGFLPEGRRYTATIYGDAFPNGEDSKAVKIEERPVDARTVLTADLAANGGQAIHLVPADSAR